MEVDAERHARFAGFIAIALGLAQAFDHARFHFVQRAAQNFVLAHADLGAEGAVDARLQCEAEVFELIDVFQEIAVQAELHARFDDQAMRVGGGGEEWQRHAILRTQIHRAGARIDQKASCAAHRGEIDGDIGDGW